MRWIMSSFPGMRDTVEDVITQVGKTTIESADDLISALEKEDLKKGVRLYVTNGEASRFVVVTSEK